MRNCFKIILIIIFLIITIVSVTLSISLEFNDVKYEYIKAIDKEHPLNNEILHFNIDNYPKLKTNHEITQYYCNDCHNLSLAYNTHYSGNQWDRIVSKMMLKEESNISKRLAKKIIEFLKIVSHEKIENPNTVFKNKKVKSNASLLSIFKLSEDTINESYGRTLYENFCAICHSSNGEGGIGLKLNNPQMIDIFIRNDAYFYKNTISMGRKGTLMKGWGYEYLGIFDENQIECIIEYIKNQWFTIPTGKTEPMEYEIKTLNISSTIDNGAKIYNTLCYSCHNPILTESRAPDIRNNSFVGLDRNGKPYTIDNEQLRFIISNGRDGTLMKPFSIKGNGLFELTNQDIDSIILYLRKRPVIYK